MSGAGACWGWEQARLQLKRCRRAEGKQIGTRAVRREAAPNDMVNPRVDIERQMRWEKRERLCKSKWPERFNRGWVAAFSFEDVLDVYTCYTSINVCYCPAQVTESGK